MSKFKCKKCGSTKAYVAMHGTFCYNLDPDKPEGEDIDWESETSDIVMMRIKCENGHIVEGYDDKLCQFMEDMKWRA
jgi:hypothetical protein